MGPMLTKPVTTRILERESTPNFHIGVSYMNGYRDKMEDAHTVYPKGDWGFFGVFDGHCGPKCSEYVARRFRERLETEQLPISDETLQDISLEVDNEFLGLKDDGGSTGTFMTAQKKGAKYVIQVGNVGDSRVVLGRRAKRVTVSMTEDHKPTLPQERDRIYKAGGTVSNCRVDGSLAVSRAFGDAQYKNLAVHDSKVIAVPEFTHEECDEGDVVLLCCDGVFESGVFENNSVMEFIFEKLEAKMDLALIAAEVCNEAMLRGSKDNISAMIVQLGGELDCKDKHPHKEVLAGPFSCPGNEKFTSAYEAMAEKGGLTISQCADLRYDQAVALLEQLKEASKCTDRTCDFSTLGRTDLQRLASKTLEGCDVTSTDAQLAALLKEQEIRLKDDEGLDLRPVDVQEIEMEIASIALPKHLAEQQHGSEEREAWFNNWINQAEAESEKTENDELMQRVKEIQQQVGLPPQLLMSLLRARGGP